MKLSRYAVNGAGFVLLNLWPEFGSLCIESRMGLVMVKVKERIVLSEIHLRTTGRHLSIGSHSVICHPTEVTAPPSPHLGRIVLDLSTP